MLPFNVTDVNVRKFAAVGCRNDMCGALASHCLRSRLLYPLGIVLRSAFWVSVQDLQAEVFKGRLQVCKKRTHGGKEVDGHHDKQAWVCASSPSHHHLARSSRSRMLHASETTAPFLKEADRQTRSEEVRQHVVGKVMLCIWPFRSGSEVCSKPLGPNWW